MTISTIDAIYLAEHLVDTNGIKNTMKLLAEDLVEARAEIEQLERVLLAKQDRLDEMEEAQERRLI